MANKKNSIVRNYLSAWGQNKKTRGMNDGVIIERSQRRFQDKTGGPRMTPSELSDAAQSGIPGSRSKEYLKIKGEETKKRKKQMGEKWYTLPWNKTVN